MNDIDPEEYNNIIQEIDAAEEEGESALSLFLHDLIEIDIESNFSFSYAVIERVLNICVKSLNNNLILLSNECLYFIRYCVNKCGNIKEADENFFKNISTIISVCLNERNYPDDAFLLFERNFFLFVQDINNVFNFIDVWNGHVDYLNDFIRSLLQITAFHLCLLNETICHLRNNTSTNKQKRKKITEETNIVPNQSDYSSACQNTSVDCNTSLGVSSFTQTENCTKSEVSESNVSFIQKGYSRLKIIEIASCLLLYFFENSVEIENIESFEECVNIILKEYENIPDIEIKKKILCLFKSINEYAAEKELMELPFNKSIINLIKRKRNYYLTLTKEKDINISYLKENAYVYINNTLLSIQTVSEFTDEGSDNTKPVETTVLTPTGFKGSLLINIFYIYFYNTRNELLMVLSYDRINLKQDEENGKRITLLFSQNDATGILSNKLKEKFEEYFQDIIEISISFQSVETKKKIYGILSSIVKIESAKANVEDIVVEEEAELEAEREAEREAETSLKTETDIEHNIEEEAENKEDKHKKEKESLSNKKTIETEKGEGQETNTGRELKRIDENPKKIIQEKLQRRKVSFATTKEIHLLNDNESVTSKTIPLEESINNYSHSISEYFHYGNGSVLNDPSVSVKAYDKENILHGEIKSVTSSILNKMLLNKKYYPSEKENVVDHYTLEKYASKCDLEIKKYNDGFYAVKNIKGQAKEDDTPINDTPLHTLGSLSYTTDTDRALVYLPFERKCFSEKDGDDYNKINELYAKRGVMIDMHDKSAYKQTHSKKIYSSNTKEINENENDLQSNRIEKGNNVTYTGKCDISKKSEAIKTSEIGALPKEESVEIGESSSISATEIVNELLDLSSKQHNINKCIQSLHGKDKIKNKEEASNKLIGIGEKRTEENITCTENDGRRRSKRVQAQKNTYSFEMLHMFENQRHVKNNKKEKSDRKEIEKEDVEKHEERKTNAPQDASEIVSIVGIDELSNQLIFKDTKGDRENEEKDTEKKDVHIINENVKNGDMKEETIATTISSIDRRSIVSSINKKRASTSLATDAEDCYSKCNIDSPYPLKKIKQSNYDSSFLDSLKNDENLEHLPVKYLMKAYTLIQYSRRYVHIQIVDYFRQIKRDILTTHQEINQKYNTILKEIQNEYGKKFENIIEKYSTRLISKKKKLNTNVPQILDLQMIQHKIKGLEELSKIIQNTIKNKIENSNILLKYKESDLYTPTFSLATLMSKNSH